VTSINVILSQNAQQIKDFVASSEKFLKIVTFRFDSREFADILIEKAKRGVAIEVVTTPPDNVAKGELRPVVEAMYKELERNGAKLYSCHWEAGEPRLTTTSMSGKQSAGIGDKWYSLHLQIFINEKHALVTSKPLTSESTLDVFYLSSDPDFVDNALRKFDRIQQLFLKPKKVEGLTIPGDVTNFLDQKMLKNTIDFFTETKRLNAKQYYLEQLPPSKLRKGLFISPFEGKMRDFLYDFIDSASEYVYFFLETFFDEELVGKLQEKVAANPETKIKIITSPPERIRQSPQKARELINQVLSLGIQVGYLPNIQAKFWVSDKWLAIPSGDFNRMNLGHFKGKNYWKADTQLLLLDNSSATISHMKREFAQHFKPMDIGSTCAKDINTLLKRMVKSSNLRGSKDASKYIARFKTALIIKTERDVRYVIDLAIKLTKLYNKSRLEGCFMLMAVILYHLQRREHRLEEIVEKLENVENEAEVKEAVTRLEGRGLLTRSGGLYRISVNLEGLKTDTQKNMNDF
jgi:phosphatidylserine/phosphatidylglycerophosphate/cardiolipin synthase-like enzyme